MKCVKFAQIALVLTCLCIASCNVSKPKQAAYNSQPLYKTGYENLSVKGNFHDQNNINQNLLVYTYY